MQWHKRVNQLYAQYLNSPLNVWINTKAAHAIYCDYCITPWCYCKELDENGLIHLPGTNLLRWDAGDLLVNTWSTLEALLGFLCTAGPLLCTRLGGTWGGGEGGGVGSLLLIPPVEWAGEWGLLSLTTGADPVEPIDMGRNNNKKPSQNQVFSQWSSMMAISINLYTGSAF